MRINLLSRVKLVLKAGLLPTILILAVTPAVKAATAPIVFSGLESFPYGGTFVSATGLATDVAGNVYVSGPSQNQVVKIAPNGSSTPLSISGLNAPRGLVVDSSNNLWIANNGGTNLIRYPLGGGAQSSLGGFNQPINLAIDAAGSLYVSNGGNNTIIKVTGGVLTTMPISGLSGGVRGLAVDGSDNLFIALINSNQVLDVSATTGALKGTIVADSACSPRDVAVNPSGDLFIACVNKSTIYRIPNEAGILTLADKSVVASSGIPANQGVHGLAFGSGTLYASGNVVVDKIQLDSVNLGAFLIGSPNATVVSTATLNFFAINTVTLGQVAAYSEGIIQSDPNGPADFQIAGTTTTCKVAGGTFGAGSACTVTINFAPNAVGVRHGGIVFSDTSAPMQSAFTFPLFGTGLGGRVAYGPGLVNAFNPTIGAAKLTGPVAVELDGAGNRYVADSQNNRVVKFDQLLTTSTVVGTGLTFPNGVAVDGSGNVYIADGVLGIVMVPNENGVLNSSHQSVVTANVQFPSGIRFDDAQNLYVADTFNNRILKIPFEDGKVNGLHQQVIGSGFVQPFGVAPDSKGNVWVADTGNNRVVKIAPNGTQTTLVIDPAQISIPTNGVSLLDGPGDVVLDAAGDLYISDSNNIRVIYVSAVGNIQAVVPGAGTPTPPPAPSGGFGGIWISPVGFLYVSDFTGGILEIQDFPFPLAFPNTTRGATSAPQIIEVSNIGNAPLGFKRLSFPRDFRQLAVGTAAVPDCSSSTSLAPGTSCILGVVFRPRSRGAKNEILNIVNTDLNSTVSPYNTDQFTLTGLAK